MSKLLLTTALAAGLAGCLSATPTFAQVRYAPRATPSSPFFPQNDESYDTHPSYQIGTNAYGATTVNVIHRCAYIGGWNAGDFVREQQGTPLGIGHTCPAGQPGAGVRAAY